MTPYPDYRVDVVQIADGTTVTMKKVTTTAMMAMIDDRMLMKKLTITAPSTRRKSKDREALEGNCLHWRLGINALLLLWEKTQASHISFLIRFLAVQEHAAEIKGILLTYLSPEAHFASTASIFYVHLSHCALSFCDHLSLVGLAFFCFVFTNVRSFLSLEIM